MRNPSTKTVKNEYDEPGLKVRTKTEEITMNHLLISAKQYDIKMQIAILGATGHIAKNLIFEMYKRSEFHLNLFARKIDALYSFINLVGRLLNGENMKYQELFWQLFF